jgi:cytochrome P450
MRMDDATGTGSGGEVLDIASLPSFADVGFAGGRDSFQAFCRTIFAAPSPRFLRGPQGELAVFRHADLRAFGARPEVGNVPPAVLFPAAEAYASSGGDSLPGAALFDVIKNQAFTTNDPIHAPLRRILLNRFNARSAESLAPLAERVVDGLLAEMPREGVFDFVETVADRLTSRFFGAFLGMTDDEQRAVEAAVRDFSPMFFIDKTLEDIRTLDSAMLRYRDAVRAAVTRGLAAHDPALEAMAADLAALGFDGDLSEAGIVPRDLADLVAGNFVDAFHTAALAAANTAHALLTRPDVLARVRADAALLQPAIFEALRLEPPVLFLNRLVLRDFDHDGLRIAKGTSVIMLWGAGNLDPEAFADPFAFDLERRHQGVTTFGGGAHICPGRFVAVMLVRVLLQRLLAEAPGLELQQPACPWFEGHMMSQMKTMPVTRRPD